MYHGGDQVGAAPGGCGRDAADRCHDDATHALPLPRRSACAAASAAAGKLNLGIGTYTYHSLSIDDMIVQLKRLKIREIEMSRGEFMLFSKPTAEQFECRERKFDAAGIQCVSYYTATIKDDRRSRQSDPVREASGRAQHHGRRDRRHPEAHRRAVRRGRPDVRHSQSYFKQKFAYESPEDVLARSPGRSKTMGASLDIGQYRVLRLRYGGCGPQAGALSEDGASEGHCRRRARRSTCCSARASRGFPR